MCRPCPAVIHAASLVCRGCGCSSAMMGWPRPHQSQSPDLGSSLYSWSHTAPPGQSWKVAAPILVKVPMLILTSRKLCNFPVHKNQRRRSTVQSRVPQNHWRSCFICWPLLYLHLLLILHVHTFCGKNELFHAIIIHYSWNYQFMLNIYFCRRSTTAKKAGPLINSEQKYLIYIIICWMTIHRQNRGCWCDPAADRRIISCKYYWIHWM